MLFFYPTVQPLSKKKIFLVNPLMVFDTTNGCSCPATSTRPEGECGGKAPLPGLPTQRGAKMGGETWLELDPQDLGQLDVDPNPVPAVPYCAGHGHRFIEVVDCLVLRFAHDLACDEYAIVAHYSRFHGVDDFDRPRCVRRHRYFVYAALVLVHLNPHTILLARLWGDAHPFCETVEPFHKKCLVHNPVMGFKPTTGIAPIPRHPTFVRERVMGHLTLERKCVCDFVFVGCCGDGVCGSLDELQLLLGVGLVVLDELLECSFPVWELLNGV